MAQGRISLLIDSPLRDLISVLRDTPREIKSQIGKYTKSEAKPIWTSELRERAHTRIQQKVLVSPASVSVTARNVTLAAGGKGTLTSGTPVADLTAAAEFGLNAAKVVTCRSRRGKTYTRRAGSVFGPSHRKGNTALPAAGASVSRIVSLWVQTAYRTIHEAIEKA